MTYPPAPQQPGQPRQGQPYPPATAYPGAGFQPGYPFDTPGTAGYPGGYPGAPGPTGTSNQPQSPGFRLPPSVARAALDGVIAQGVLVATSFVVALVVGAVFGSVGQTLRYGTFIEAAAAFRGRVNSTVDVGLFSVQAHASVTPGLFFALVVGTLILLTRRREKAHASTRWADVGSTAGTTALVVALLSIAWALLGSVTVPAGTAGLSGPTSTRASLGIATSFVSALVLTFLICAATSILLARRTLIPPPRLPLFDSVRAGVQGVLVFFLLGSVLSALVEAVWLASQGAPKQAWLVWVIDLPLLSAGGFLWSMGTTVEISGISGLATTIDRLLGSGGSSASTSLFHGKPALGLTSAHGLEKWAVLALLIPLVCAAVAGVRLALRRPRTTALASGAARTVVALLVTAYAVDRLVTVSGGGGASGIGISLSLTFGIPGLLVACVVWATALELLGRLLAPVLLRSAPALAHRLAGTVDSSWLTPAQTGGNYPAGWQPQPAGGYYQQPTAPFQHAPAAFGHYPATPQPAPPPVQQPAPFWFAVLEPTDVQPVDGRSAPFRLEPGQWYLGQPQGFELDVCVPTGERGRLRDTSRIHRA